MLSLDIFNTLQSYVEKALTGLRTSGYNEFKWHGKGLELDCNQQCNNRIKHEKMSDYCCSLFISDSNYRNFQYQVKRKNIWDTEDFRPILISDSQKHTTLFMKRNLREVSKRCSILIKERSIWHHRDLHFDSM
jgi:hypothetical protein